MAMVDGKQRASEPLHPTSGPAAQRSPFAPRMSPWIPNRPPAPPLDPESSDRSKPVDALPAAQWRRPLLEIPLFPRDAPRSSDRAHRADPSTTPTPIPITAPPVHRKPIIGSPGYSHEHRAEEVKGKADHTGMPAPVRAKMENVFKADFSNVRVHPASARAVELGALAFAQGNEIHVAPGHWAPETPKGQELLGHELGHVMQQWTGKAKTTELHMGVGLNDEPALEREADVMGMRAAHGRVAGEPILHRRTGQPRANAPIQRRVNPEAASTFAPGTLVVVAKTSFTKNGLVMAPNINSSKTVAVLKIGALLKLGDLHPQGASKVFYATVMKNKDEAYNDATGVVRTEWVRVASDADMIAAPAPTFPASSPSAAPSSAAPDRAAPPAKKTKRTFAPGNLVELARTNFTKDGLVMGADLGPSRPVATLNPGALLKLGAPHPRGKNPSGEDEVFYATVMKSATEPDPKLVGVVRTEWIRPAPPPQPAPATASPAANDAKASTSLAEYRNPTNNALHRPGDTSATGVLTHIESTSDGRIVLHWFNFYNGQATTGAVEEWEYVRSLRPLSPKSRDFATLASQMSPQEWQQAGVDPTAEVLRRFEEEVVSEGFWNPANAGSMFEFAWHPFNMTDETFLTIYKGMIFAEANRSLDANEAELDALLSAPDRMTHLRQFAEELREVSQIRDALEAERSGLERMLSDANQAVLGLQDVPEAPQLHPPPDPDRPEVIRDQERVHKEVEQVLVSKNQMLAYWMSIFPQLTRFRTSDLTPAGIESKLKEIKQDIGAAREQLGKALMGRGSIDLLQLDMVRARVDERLGSRGLAVVAQEEKRRSDAAMLSIVPSLGIGFAISLLPGGAFLNAAVGVAMAAQRWEDARVIGQMANTGLGVDDGLISRAVAGDAQDSALLQTILATVPAARTGARVLKTSAMFRHVRAVAPEMRFEAQLRLARLLASNPRLAAGTATIEEIEEILAKQAGRFSPQELAALRAAIARINGRITYRVPGLYESVKTDKKQGNITFVDEKRIDTMPDGSIKHSIDTWISVTAPDGKVYNGSVIRTILVKTNPVTGKREATLIMEVADLEQIPKPLIWTKAGGVDLRPGAGVPLQTYATIRQLKLAGIQPGEITNAQMTQISNVRTILELASLKKQQLPSAGVDDFPAELEADLIMQTHSGQYGETNILQSGGRITKVAVEGGQMGKVADVAAGTEYAAPEVLAKMGLNPTDMVKVRFTIRFTVEPVKGTGVTQ